MDAALISVAGFLCAGSSVAALWLFLAQQRDPMRRRLLDAVASSERQADDAELPLTLRGRLGRWAQATPLTRIIRALRMAPQARTIPGLETFAQQVMLVGLLALVGAAGALLTRRAFSGSAFPATVVIGSMAAAAVAGMWLSTRGWLHWHARRWAEQITSGLVNVLDLWVLCLGSGMSFQASLVRVTEESELTNSLLREQLQLTHQAILAGASREDALRYFARRCGDLPEVRSLVAHIIHAERLGSSLVQTLKIYAQNLRFARSQDAKEWIQKLPVKLAVPLVFCVLPALLVIISGPAMLRIIQALSNQ